MNVRVLCLGNDLLADDGVGPEIGRRLKALELSYVEVMITQLSGLHLLDIISEECKQLIIIDTIITGTAPAGTVHVLEAADMRRSNVRAPHSSGLPEVLAIARALRLPVPHTRVFAVEASDCSTIGGPISQSLQQAIPEVVERVRREIEMCFEEERALVR